MILWEIVAYLADDTQRRTAFEALRKQVGLTPKKILAAPKELLSQITRIGGSIAAEERADCLRAAAQLTLDEFGENLASVLKLPPQKAKKSLMRFPMIGEPGAEKIVFFYRSREAVKLGCRKILLYKISSFGYSMVDESIRRPTGT